MKFGQLIEFNLRNILPQKLCRKWDKEEDQFPISFCLFFNKALYEVKASGYHLSFNIFWTYNRNKLYETSGCLIQRQHQFWFFKNGSGTSFSTTFCAWFFKKNIILLYPMFDCHYFLKYLAVCALKLFVIQSVTS